MDSVFVAIFGLMTSYLQSGWLASGCLRRPPLSSLQRQWAEAHSPLSEGSFSVALRAGSLFYGEPSRLQRVGTGSCRGRQGSPSLDSVSRAPRISIDNSKYKWFPYWPLTCCHSTQATWPGAHSQSSENGAHMLQERHCFLDVQLFQLTDLFR